MKSVFLNTNLCSDYLIFTFALVPGRFLLKIVEPSAIFMVAKITFSSPDIWCKYSETLLETVDVRLKKLRKHL